MPLLLLLALACTGSADTDTGDAPTPEAPWPEWAFHHWVWEDESTDASATALVDSYLERDIPVGAVIIDSPWATGYSTFEFDPARFPDPEGFVASMHDRGVRVFLWTVPGINVDEEIYDDAAERDWFMKGSATADGPKVVDWWKGQGSLIDYFNPEAVDWWHGLVDHALAADIDGWKCDGLDFSAILAPYSPGAGRTVERLEYSHAYYRDFFDYTREQLGSDRIITSRPVDNYGMDVGGDLAAFTPVDIAWASWVGDQDADLEGLTWALNNLYHSSEYGYVASGFDIGGYRDDDSELGRTKEQLLRWAQVGAFCPVMENGGGGVHQPWRFDAETEEHYRTLVELHYALLPYLMEEGGLAFDAERSLQTFTSKETYAFLLGPDVFMIPILQDGGVVEGVLPDAGRWVWLFDDSVVYEAGEAVQMTLPVTQAAVFFREGSAVGDALLAVLER